MAKIRNWIVFILFFLIFFVWATYGSILLPFKIFFPIFHITFIFFAVIFGLFFRMRDVTSEDFRFGRSPYFLLPLGGFLISLTIAYTFFQGMPHIQDSVNYLAMAQNFVHGRLHNRMPDHYEFFQFAYMLPDGEKTYSLFLPGFSFFLVPFVWLGVPVLANPLLTAFNIFLTGRIAQKLFNEKVAVLSMWLMLFSTFFIVMGGTWMAHPFCAALTLSAALVYLEMKEKGSPVYPVLLGVSLGWLALIRPQNTLFLGIALVADFLVSTIKNRSWSYLVRCAAYSAAAFAPFIAFLLWYNSIYTGNPLIFKQDIYFNYSEPRDYCHRFGLGTGCPHSNWIELPLEGLTWTHAYLVSYRRLSPLIINFLLHPLAFLFMPVAFIFSKERSDFNKLLFLFVLFFANFAGYFFFYFDGNVFGPRYLYETSIFLFIIFAYGILRTIDGLTKNIFANKSLKVLAVSLLVSAALYQALVVTPALYRSYERGFWNIDAKLKMALDLQGIKEGVVFVAPFTMYGSGYTLMDHGDYDNNKLIFVRDLGYQQNRRIMFDFPGKRFYFAGFNRFSDNDDLPVITEISPEMDTGEIHVVLKDKFYPLTGVPDYCNIFPGRSYLDKYLGMEPPYRYISGNQFLMFCRFKNEDQYYDFKQKINISSDYEVRINALQGADMGNFRLLVDGVEAAKLKFNNTETRMNEFIFRVHLERGVREFKLVPDGLPSKYNYFMIDYIDFVPKRD